MKSLLVLVSVFALNACGPMNHHGLPVDSSVENPPGHFNIEKRRCPKFLNRYFFQRRECKQRVHQELLEKFSNRGQDRSISPVK